MVYLSAMSICNQMSFIMGLLISWLSICIRGKFVTLTLDVFLPFLGARQFTHNQESIDVSLLTICSDSLLGQS